MKSLKSTLSYQNEELVRRIQRSVGVNLNEAYLLFLDIKAWLWLCARHRIIQCTSDKGSHGYFIPDVAMIEHFKSIDIAWHEFILMTHAYQNFCNSYLDEFIHHLPAPVNTKTPSSNKKRRSKEYMIHYLSFLEEEIGSKRLKRWLTQLPIPKKET